jgi:hypothetical protein
MHKWVAKGQVRVARSWFEKRRDPNEGPTTCWTVESILHATMLDLGGSMMPLEWWGKWGPTSCDASKVRVTNCNCDLCRRFKVRVRVTGTGKRRWLGGVKMIKSFTEQFRFVRAEEIA